MKTALVTGSSGYIGSLLVQQLRIGGWKVITFDIADHRLEDINNTNLEKIFEQEQFDVVFHLAAVSSVHECTENLQRTYATNALSTIRLHELCKRYNCKMIFASTYATVTENWTTYSMSKEVAEFELLKEGSKAVVVRLPNVIGGYDGVQPKSTPSLFDNIMAYIKTGKPLIIYGNAWREYTSVQNAVSRLYNAVANSKEGEVDLVSGAFACDISRLISNIEMATKAKIVYETRPPIDPQNYSRLSEYRFDHGLLRKVIDSYDL